MGKFIVQMLNVLSGEIMDNMVGDEAFDTYEEAEDYREECGSGFAQGAEDLSLCGRDYTDPDDVEFVVEELDD